MGVIGSIPKVASMKTEKVTLATGFLQSLLARVWFVFWFQTSTKQTFESILMWLFFILEIRWRRTWLLCFFFVMRFKSAQFKKNVEHASAEAKLAKKYCNPLSIFAQKQDHIFYLGVGWEYIPTVIVIKSRYYLSHSTTPWPARKRSWWGGHDPINNSAILHVLKLFTSFFCN